MRALAVSIAAAAVLAAADASPQIYDPARPCGGGPTRVVIAGTVQTPDGRPIVNARVRIVRARELSGERIIPVSSMPLDVFSDDRGGYRAVGLCAGTYVVIA